MMTATEQRYSKWARAVWNRAKALHAKECPDAEPLHESHGAHIIAHEIAAKAHLRAEGYVYG